MGNIKLKHSKSIKRWFYIIVGCLLLIPFGQQCSNAKLIAKLENNFLLSESPFVLSAPDQYPVIRKYVILIDMSRSMISGPCPQDINESGMLFEASTMPLQPYDPNKAVGVANDYRANGSPCRVNPNLPITRSSITQTQNLSASTPVLFQTTLGSDWEGDRITIVRKWLQQIKESSTTNTLANTEVLIYPFSGGVYQQKILSNYPLQMKFYKAGDVNLTDALDYLQGIQYINLNLTQQNNIYNYQHQSMGPSAPGKTIKDLYEVLNRDMYDLNMRGELTFSQYRVMTLSDGLWTPVKKNFESVLNVYPSCSSCANNPESCTDTCGLLVAKMKEAWGNPEDQDIKQIDFNFGMIQTLPQYYGSGFVTLDFIDLKSDRRKSLHPDEVSYFEQLVPMFQSKNRNAVIWKADGNEPPFSLAMNANGAITFKLTNLYVLNTNARYDDNGVLQPDSDGDGLIDSLEAQYGTSVTNPRSNGVCLDSIAVNTAFKERCAALTQSRSCVPDLDSDGDSLNECEEMLLGTNPFSFDSDGDSIPDLIEWVYGYNVLQSDIGIDSNSDGVPNLVNLANNIGPMSPFQIFINQNLLPNYTLDYLGKTQVQNATYGQIWVDQYRLSIESFPTVNTVPVAENAGGNLYAARTPTGAVIPSNLIPPAHRLISNTSASGANNLMVLARLIDINNPQRAYWRIHKTPLYGGIAITQSVVDLSNLVEIRSIDLNAGVKN